MQIVPFAGWSKNAELIHDGLRMVVTLEVGPRILFWGQESGDNLMVIHEHDAGKTGGEVFRSYGGHRLWIAPEIPDRTFQPDNEPVLYSLVGDQHVFTSPSDKYHMQKEMRIRPISGGFEIAHRIYNHSPYAASLALWSPTQCSGGEVIFPLPDFEPHTSRVLPTTPMVLWSYTKFADPRWTWGEHVVRLAYDPALPAQKVGSLVKSGVAVCAKDGLVFVKRFGFDSDKAYPDFNCNFETFTNEAILEIESLGPLESVESGGHGEHIERWYLFTGLAPSGDRECGEWLKEIQTRFS